MLFELPSKDARLPVKERVVGITSTAGGRDAVAVMRSAVARTGVLDVTVNGQDLVVWHRPGQVSALNNERIGRGRDVGTVAVFDPVLNRLREEVPAARPAIEARLALGLPATEAFTPYLRRSCAPP